MTTLSVGHRVAEAIPCRIQQVGDITKQVDKKQSVRIPNFVRNISFKSLFNTKVIEITVGGVPITRDGNGLSAQVLQSSPKQLDRALQQSDFQSGIERQEM